jgi:hypothetical protein
MMIHLNLIVKGFTFIFWHFVFSATSSNVHPSLNWLCHQSRAHKTKNMKLLSSKMIMALIIPKNKIHIILSNIVTMWLKTFKYTCCNKCLFFWAWKFAQMRKINIEKGGCKQRVKGRRKKENRKSEPLFNNLGWTHWYHDKKIQKII